MAELNIINVNLEDYDHLSIKELEKLERDIERTLEKLTGEKWEAKDEELIVIQKKEIEFERKHHIISNVITAREMELYGQRPIESRY